MSNSIVPLGNLDDRNFDDAFTEQPTWTSSWMTPTENKVASK